MDLENLGQLSEKAMAIILVIGSILIFCLLVALFDRKKKKNEKLEKQIKEQEEKENLFATFIKEAVNLYGAPEKKHIYQEIYSSFMKCCLSKEKDEKLKNIPSLKKRYVRALGKLVAIQDDNTVFFTTKEEKDAFEETMDLGDRDKKISEDIIKTLPPLVEFIEVHKELVQDIYDEYLCGITRMYSHLWMGLRHDISKCDNEYVREKIKEWIESCCDNLLKSFRFYIEDLGWNVIQDSYPQYKTKEDYDKFIEIAENDDESYHKWMDLWCINLDEIAIKDGYAALHTELCNFFEQTNELYDNPAWLEYPTSSFRLDHYSSFSITDIYDTKELMRIHAAYVSGELKGEYGWWKDPNSKFKKIGEKK